MTFKKNLSVWIAIYIVIVLEYCVVELYEISDAQTKEDKKKRITPRTTKLYKI